MVASIFFKSQLVVFCKHNQTDSKKLCRWRPPAAQTLDSAWAVNGNESIFCPADPLPSTQWGMSPIFVSLIPKNNICQFEKKNQ